MEGILELLVLICELRVQVILFSDILTPFTGMNIPFDILKTKGPIIHNPIRTAADVAKVRELVPAEAVPYVGQALTALREEVRRHLHHFNSRNGKLF